MASLRIRLIGCGFITRCRSRAIRSLKRPAVCDTVPERARSFADTAGVPRLALAPQSHRLVDAGDRSAAAGGQEVRLA